MKTNTEERPQTTVAARIAGEDIARGDFVTVMNETIELPSFLWNCSDVSLAPEEPVRIKYASSEAGQPRQVIGVCLPFVYVKTHFGSVVTIDTRLCQLVRLDENCARAIWKELKAPFKKKRK
jgi:hypothetical protein